MTTNLRFAMLFLAISTLTSLLASPVFAAKGGNKVQPIIITEVLVRESDGKNELDCLGPSQTTSEVIEISGVNFPDWGSEGTDPLIVLGDYVDPLVICGLTPGTILAICPDWVTPDTGINRFECNKDGDFLLTVYTEGSEASYDLTIGAVGPEGPQGLEGPAGPAGPAGPQGPAGPAAVECPCFTPEKILGSPLAGCDTSENFNFFMVSAYDEIGNDHTVTVNRSSSGGTDVFDVFESAECESRPEVAPRSITAFEALQCIQMIRASCAILGY